jgi:hypothetical protein
MTNTNLNNLKVINISKLCFKNSKGTYTFESSRVYGIINLDTNKIFSFDGIKPYHPDRKALLRLIDKNDSWYMGNYTELKWIEPVKRPS